MTNKIVSDFYCDEIEDIARETQSYLADVIELCVADQDIPSFLEKQILSQKEKTTGWGGQTATEPLTSWRIHPLCLLEGADPAFLNRYADAAKRIRGKVTPRQAGQLRLKQMVADRLAGMDLPGQRQFLHNALHLHTDISSLYNTMRFCDQDDRELCAALCRQFHLEPQNFYSRVGRLAGDAVETRNTYLGHRTKGVTQNMTAKAFKASVEIFVSLAAALPLPDPAPLQALYAHRDRVVKAADCEPLTLVTLQQSIPGFDRFILLQSRLAKEYDKSRETLYLHQLPEVEEVMGNLQKRYDEASAQMRQELGAILREGQSQINHSFRTMARRLDGEGTGTAPAAPVSREMPRPPAGQHRLDPFPRMAEYTAGRLTQPQQQEIFRRCNLLADISCWIRRDGQRFLAEQVLPAQSGSGRWVIVDWATRVELYRLETDPDTPADRKQQAHEARIAMSHLHRQGKIKYAPERPGARSSQASLMEVVERNPDKTICLLTMDWDFCQALAKADYPNLMPLLVTGSAGCSVHPALRPLVHRNSLGYQAQTPEASATGRAGQPDEAGETPQTTQPAPAPQSPQPTPTPRPDPAPKPIQTAKPTQPSKPEVPQPAAPGTGKETPVRCICETGELLPWQKPAEGMTLCTQDGREIRLGARMAEGGEGQIYATSDPDLVAKLYNKEHLTRNRRDKLTRMAGRSLGLRELCWPTALLFHPGNWNFAGFLMPRVGQEYRELTTSVLQLGKPSVRQALPDWDRLALVRVCRQICRVLVRLHEANILLGDINTRNILVRIDTPQDPQIMVVDCDSCQIDGYPCPVGTPLHTSPAIYKRLNTDNPNYGSFLRTEADEDFALAVLIFELLMLNQSPYSGKGVTDLGQAVREGRFAYRFVPRDSTEAASDGSDTPDGPYRMIWGNMPYQTREGFYNTFAQGKPLSAKRWGQVLYNYEREMTTSDVYTRELTPQRYFDPDGTFTVDFTCEECGKQANMPRGRWENNHRHNQMNLCNNCFSAMKRLQQDPQKVQVHCVVCGKAFPGNKWQATLEGRGQADRGRWQDRVCPDCRQEVQAVCARCHKPITITKAKLRSLKRKGREPLCHDCIHPNG